MKVVKRCKLLVLSTYWDVMCCMATNYYSNILLHIGKFLRDLNSDHEEKKNVTELMDVN